MVNKIFMASKFSDGWLWASLGQYTCRRPEVRLTRTAILGYLGSFAVHRQLVAIRQASEVTRHDKRPNISQHTEDGKTNLLSGAGIMLNINSAEAESPC